MKHPMQPILIVVEGDERIARFQKNAIIRALADDGRIDWNEIAILAGHGVFDKDDQMQLSMLLGHSVSGFGGLDCADTEFVALADAKVEQLLKGRPPAGPLQIDELAYLDQLYEAYTSATDKEMRERTLAKFVRILLKVWPEISQAFDGLNHGF